MLMSAMSHPSVFNAPTCSPHLWNKPLQRGGSAQLQSACTDASFTAHFSFCHALPLSHSFFLLQGSFCTFRKQTYRVLPGCGIIHGTSRIEVMPIWHQNKQVYTGFKTWLNKNAMYYFVIASRSFPLWFFPWWVTFNVTNALETEELSNLPSGLHLAWYEEKKIPLADVKKQWVHKRSWLVTHKGSETAKIKKTKLARGAGADNLRVIWPGSKCWLYLFPLQTKARC